MVGEKLIKLQTCKRCRRRSPSQAKFCMHCGLNMHPKSTKFWPGKILQVRAGLDPNTIVEVVLEKVDSKYINFDTRKVTEGDIRSALSRLSEKKRQVIIRLTGADGKGVRSPKETAEEAGIKLASLRHTTRYAFFEFAMMLRLVRPNSVYTKREQRFTRGLRLVQKQVRAKTKK